MKKYFYFSLILILLSFFISCSNSKNGTTISKLNKSFPESNLRTSSYSNVNTESDFQDLSNSFLIFDSKGDLLHEIKNPFKSNETGEYAIKSPNILASFYDDQKDQIIYKLYDINNNSIKEYPGPDYYQLNINLQNRLLDNDYIVFLKDFLDLKKELNKKYNFYDMNFQAIDFYLNFKPSNLISEIDLNHLFFSSIPGYQTGIWDIPFVAINALTFNKYSKQYIITYTDHNGIGLLHIQLFNEDGEYIKDITFKDRYQGFSGVGYYAENSIYSLSDHEILLYRSMDLGLEIESGFNPWLYIDTNTSFAKEIPITYIDAINTDYRTLITRYLNNDGEEKRAAIKIDDGGNIKILSEINVDNESYITTFSPYSEAKTVYLDSFIYPYTCSKDYFFILGEDLQNKKVYVLKYIYETQEYKKCCELPYIEGYRYSIANVDNEENVWVFIQD